MGIFSRHTEKLERNRAIQDIVMALKWSYVNAPKNPFWEMQVEL